MVKMKFVGVIVGGDVGGSGDSGVCRSKHRRRKRR